MLTRSSASATLVLAQYQKIADVTGSMLGAARQGDWDQVLAFNQQYSQAVDILRGYDEAVISMTAQERATKRDLLVRILEHDAVTRELLSPQLAWLNSLLGQLKRQKSLLRAYGQVGLGDVQVPRP